MIDLVRQLYAIENDLQKEGIRSEDYAELLREQSEIFLTLGKKIFNYLEPLIKIGDTEC